MKRIKILLIALILLILGVAFCNTNIYAVEVEIPESVELTSEQTWSGKDETGKSEKEYYNKSQYEHNAYIVKIYEKNNESNSRYYCLNYKTNFDTDKSTFKKKLDMFDVNLDMFNVNLDMFDVNNKTSIKKTSIIDKLRTDITDDEYNKLLWVLDNLYLPGDNKEKPGDTREEFKTRLNNIEGVQMQLGSELDSLTDDDIYLVQQLVIWHYANMDAYAPDSFDSLNFYRSETENGQNVFISQEPPYEDEEDALSKLYQQFIADADKAGNPEIKPEYEVKAGESNKLQIVKENGQYKVGPIKFINIQDESDQNAKIPISQITLTDGAEKPIETSYNDFKQVIPISSTRGNIQELTVGQEYYIYINNNNASNYDLSQVTIKVTNLFNETYAYLYEYGDEGSQQPVVRVDRVPTTSESSVTATKEKIADLALRKYITAVDGSEFTPDSRTPKIEGTENIGENRGKGDHTATYNHRKDPVQVKNGDIITYTIRVYNEGTIAGRAKKIIDQLPKGLTYAECPESGRYSASYDEGSNRITLTESNNTNLPAYSGSGDPDSDPESDEVIIKCKVTAEPTEQQQVLTNIAWIEEDAFEEDVTDINDIDSQPTNAPTESEEDLPGYKGNNSNQEDLTKSDYHYKGQEDDDDFEKVVVKGKTEEKLADLSLRKYITAVEGSSFEQQPRTPTITDTNKIGTNSDKGDHTATYNHRKDPVQVKTGDTVTYTIRVYNEGAIEGRATKIIDQLPKGLKYVDGSASGDYEVQEDGYEEASNKITLIKKDETNLVAYTGSGDPDSDKVTIKCKVTAESTTDQQVLTNIAWIAEDKFAEDDKADIDSQPTTAPNASGLVSSNANAYKGDTSNESVTPANSDGYWKGQQDDDDFEKVVVKGKTEEKEFDLSLRKYISSIKRNGEELEIGDRSPKIDTGTLITGTFKRNDKLEHTATYEHPKNPLVVKQGDVVTYTIRVYNEGEIDGYVEEITDYIPEGLALIKDYKTNFENGWKLPTDIDSSKIMDLVGENGFYKTEDEVKNLKATDFENINGLNDVKLIKGEVPITTEVIKDDLIKAFDKEKTAAGEGEKWQAADKGGGGLSYKEVEVSCLVIADNTYKGTITNIAEITEDKDAEGHEVEDRDSEPKNKQDPYTTWQEDDDDYEPVELKYFDLALRKFITGVETNGETKEVTTRIPTPKVGEDGHLLYEHEKTPVLVASNDIVIYTLRVYNEGTQEGYAEEITDDIPEGLEYLAEHEINKQYEWKMYDKEGNITDNVEEADAIKTDYLSEEKEEKGVRDNLIRPYDANKEISTEEPYNPDYKEVKVAFKVTEPNTSDRIITNSAQISKDSDDDIDSEPNEWNEGEDDQDKEHIYVQYFDLSLLKWVTKTIVTVDGKTTTTETGFEPNTGLTETGGIRDNNENEPVAKVEIDKKKIDKTTVQFVYKIRVTNEGEIEGYASEITDYIPEGLEFREEDNKAYGWVKEGENKVKTRALETVLLKPGESAEVEIVFTWKKDKNNLGIKTNIAEISEDYNDHNSKDIDSVPGNKKDPYNKEQEDDDDFALVVLSLKTGREMGYTLLTTIVISVLALGIYLIKRFVLDY